MVKGFTAANKLFKKKTVVSLKQFLNAPKIGILKLHCLILEHVLVLILQKVFPPLH